MSLGKKLFVGSASNVINLLLQIASGFVLMPMSIHALGESVFGIWTLFAVVTGYYTLLDFGLTQAVSRFISKAIGEQSGRDVASLTATAFYVFLVICLLAVGLTLLASCFTQGLFKTTDEARIFNDLLYIFCLNALIVYPTSVFSGLLVAHMRYDMVNGLRIVTTALKFFGTIWLLKAGYGIYSLAALATVSNLIEHLPKVFWAYRVDANLSIHPRQFAREKLRALFGYSTYTFVANLADLFRFQIPPFLITSYVSIAAVTHFRVGSRLIEFYTMFIVGVFSVLMPYFSRKHGESNHEEIRRNYLIASRLCVMLASFVGLSVIFYGDEFIRVWVGAGYEDAYQVLAVLCVGYLLALSQNPSISLLYGIGQQKFVAYTNLGEALCNFALCLVLIPRYGITGAAISIALPMTVSKLVVQPYFVSRVLQMGYAGFLANTFLIPLVISVALFALIALGIRQELHASYPSIIGWGMCHTVLFALTGFYLVLTRDERGRLSQLAFKVLGRGV